MVKVQNTTTTLPIFTVTTTASILIIGLLAVLSINVIPMQQQAIAQVGSSVNPNPNPQGQGSSLQGNPIGSNPQSSGPNQGGGNPIGSTNQQGSEQSTDNEQQIQAQPPGKGCEFTPGANASKTRCIH